MILCVTLNPVLDTTFFVDEMRPVYRTEAQRVTYVAGGKGDNVARALGVLGEPAHALVALGGDTGRHVANLLIAEGIAATPAWVSGETRLQITVVDRALVQRSFYARPRHSPRPTGPSLGGGSRISCLGPMPSV